MHIVFKVKPELYSAQLEWPYCGEGHATCVDEPASLNSNTYLFVHRFGPQDQQANETWALRHKNFISN